MSHIVTIRTEVRDHAAVGARRSRGPRSSSAAGTIVRLPEWTYPDVIDATTGQVRHDIYNGQHVLKNVTVTTGP